jgi:hypothetical protein
MRLFRPNRLVSPHRAAARLRAASLRGVGSTNWLGLVRNRVHRSIGANGSVRQRRASWRGEPAGRRTPPATSSTRIAPISSQCEGLFTAASQFRKRAPTGQPSPCQGAWPAKPASPAVWYFGFSVLLLLRGCRRGVRSSVYRVLSNHGAAPGAHPSINSRQCREV